MTEPITTHVDDAQARLTEFYKRKPRMRGVVGALAQQSQAEEDALWQVQVCRSIQDAEGVQLDKIGAIVGVSRPSGYTDPQYRIVILAKIGQNNSNGETEAVIAIASLITGSTKVRLEEHFPAAISIHIDGEVEAEVTGLAKDLLRRAVAAGVSLDYVVQSSPTAKRFKFAGGPFRGGFGDVNDPTVGGGLATLL